MDLKSKIILISGPTASGKSKFAISLAKNINGEIINADSMQVFKELKILTARPNIKDANKIKHHLYGYKSVKENYSVGDWLKDSKIKIFNIKKKNKVPILVGGTGLYFKALIDGIVKIPNVPISIRNKIRQKHIKIGQNKFYSELVKIDPISKNMINKNDSQRTIRAFEVKKFTKKSLFDWYKSTSPDFKKNEFVKLYIDYPRTELLKQISKRTDAMIKEGAILEADRFNKLKISKDLSSSKVIGLTEIKDYLNKKISLNDLKEQISIKTRQYAKRQSTWSRGQMSEWQKIKYSDLKTFIKKFAKYA
ncbi:tRNA (adenosine(37)-N6)-dimethylallyltransferase MiaA [Candidatus Pelagibacter sp.]|nr:tRNA (adenosine(37)-N6)-dimethylallyltransferase MiaA [Candidatus Pelagibacter sp.]